MSAIRRDPWFWVQAGGLAFLAAFLLYPAGRLLLLATPEHFRTFFAKPFYTGALWNSLLLSAGATAGALLVGVPLAVLVARFDVPLKGFIRMAAVLSLLSPPFVGAYAWIILLGRAGAVNRWLGWEVSIYGWPGVLLVFILQHYAYVFLLTAGALQSQDAGVEEAAATLGAPPWRRLFTVTLPLALPSVAAGALLVFATTLADFGTPVIIGEGLRTLPVLAYNEYLSELGSSPGMAATVSLVMLAVALVVLVLEHRVVAGRSYAMQVLRRPPLRPLRPWARALAAAFAVGVSLVAVLPQAVVVVSSFMRTRGPVFTGELGLDNYVLALGRAGEIIANTFVYSGAAILVMLAGGLPLGYVLVRRASRATALIDGLMLLSQVIPGTVVGIGLIVAWGAGPLPLAGTGAILVLAYVLRRFSYTVRAAAAGLRQLSPAVEEASISLGVPPLRTFFQVTARLMLPGVLAGSVVSWVSTLSELSATMMLYSARTQTLAVAVYNQVLTDSFGMAAALASLLALATVVAMLLLGRWAEPV